MVAVTSASKHAEPRLTIPGRVLALDTILRRVVAKGFKSLRGTGFPARSRRLSLHSYLNDEPENLRRGHRIVGFWTLTFRVFLVLFLRHPGRSTVHQPQHGLEKLFNCQS